MPEAKIAQAVELLDLMLQHFADDGNWTRSRYDDGNGVQCLVGALLDLSRKHRLPRAPAIALLGNTEHGDVGQQCCEAEQTASKSRT